MNKLNNKQNKNTKVPTSPGFVSKWRVFLAKYQEWILIVEVTMILVLGYFFVLAPKITKVTEATRGDVAYWEEQLSIAKTNNARAQRLVELYNSLGMNQRDKLFKILPSDAQIPELMSQLEALFDSENIFMSNFLVSEVNFGEGAVLPFRILQVQITFTKPDDYSVYRDVLLKLEKNMRILNIQSIGYSNELDLFSISAFAYFLK